MANAAAITLRASSSAVTGTGDAVDLGVARSAAKLTLTVSAASGMLRVFLDTSPDGSTGWRAVDLIGEADAPASFERSFVGLERYVRVRFTVTTSATFGCEGDAYSVYATKRDLGARSAATIIDRATRMDEDAVAIALIDASSAAESEMVTAHGLPLSEWPAVIKRNVAAMALYYLASMGGAQGAGIDELVVKNHDDAVSWFKRVGKRDAHIAGVTPEAHPQVKLSSGNTDEPECYPSKFSDNWGDF